MVKFVYFDVGNVFHTTENFYSTVSKDFNLKRENIRNFFYEYETDLATGNMTVDEFWKIYCHKFGVTNGEKYNFVQAWVSDYKVAPEMHELAKKISEKYKVGLLTNHYFGNYPEMIKQNKIPNLKYSAVINSSEVHCKKPDVEIYQIAENKCGFKGEKIFFIDDKKENLFTASKMGWQTFLFDYKNPQKSCEEIGRILL